MRTPSLLVLALFVGLSLVAVFSVMMPAANAAGGAPRTTYSCAVSITYSPGNFYVKTTVTATNGYLPGPSETDYLQSYHGGVLYNTQSVKYSVSSNTVTIGVTVPVPTNGAGAYTFNSAILNSKGSQITSCSGTYSL